MPEDASNASFIPIVTLPPLTVFPVTCVVIIKLELDVLRLDIFVLGKGVYNPESLRFLIKGSLTLKTPDAVPVVRTSPSQTPATSSTCCNVICEPSPMFVTTLNTGFAKLPDAYEITASVVIPDTPPKLRPGMVAVSLVAST